MISPSAVQSSADHFQQGLDAYQSEVQGLTGFWEGNSYNQFQSHAEAFISEYSSITSQMNHFAQACAKYFEYMAEKANYEAAMAAAEDNANKAASGARNANELSSYARSQAEDAERYKANMERLKAEILSLLSSVSSVQLHADPIHSVSGHFNLLGFTVNENLKVSSISGYVFPFANGVKAPVTSQVGLRNRPTAGASTNHKGTDFGVPVGTEIHSLSSGTVLNTGATQGYGQWVRVQHDDGNIAIYGHLSQSNFYNPGDRVNAGDVIALSGNTGVSTGPHLHLQIETPDGGILDSQQIMADCFT